MTYLIFFLVSFLACVAGSICGIGGGVIMKPLLDATGILGVSSISFLSGCAVLSMSLVSVSSAIKGKGDCIHFTITMPLAVGAGIGGVVGKIMFEEVKRLAENENMVGFIQAFVLLLVTLLTFLYTLRKSGIRTHSFRHPAVCTVIGLLLGVMSSFLGIGGGPINLMVLSFCFSMATKEAAINSLFIILVSQIFSLLKTFLLGSLPQFEAAYLILMVLGGISGGKIGSRVNKKISAEHVQKLFVGLMVVIMGICGINMYRFR